MLIDKLTEFGDAVSVAAAASTVLLTNQIDRSVVQSFGGAGQQLYLVISVDTEIITGGVAGTITFRLVSDDTASIHATTSTVHYTSQAFVTDGTDANDAKLKAGQFPVIVALPLEGANYERYLGVQAVIATTTITAGAVSAYLTPTPPNWKAYADATN